MIYESVREIDFTRGDLPVLRPPERVLMTMPTYYDVSYAINPHMSEHVGGVDLDRAKSQWYQLRDVYRSFGYRIEIMEGIIGLPDMVFCANQTLPFLQMDGSTSVVLSRMHAPQRRDEVPYFEEFFREHDYQVHELPPSVEGSFEGMGDALWHSRRRLLWGGYGFRTEREVYQYLADLIDVPIILLELKDESFYHLDTCLSILNENTALLYPDAFHDTGRELIEEVFDTIIEVPEHEALHLMACNAHCPDGRHVVIQKGCKTTVSELEHAGFEVEPVELDEYLKAGGSVFCMKLMYW